MARKKYEQPKEETFFLDDETHSEQEVKNTVRGKIALITKTRIVIEYGDGLGTSIDFDPELHSQVKVGDEIDV